MSSPSRNTLKSVLAALLLCALLATIGTAGAAAAGGPEGDHLLATQIPVASTAQGVTLVRLDGTGASDGAGWALPTASSGSANRFTLGGESSAVGALARSANGRYVTLAGTTAAVGANPEASDARVVARIDGAGTVDTSTTLGRSFGSSKVRGAVTADGSGFWVTGNGNTDGSTPLGGMVYQPLGATGSPTVVVSRETLSSSNKAFNNFRTVQIAGGNLYTGSEKGTAGVYQVAGLPTKPTAPSAVTTFSGEVDPISELPLEHVAGSGTVDLMYVAKEGSGIYKYSFNGSSWTERGRLASGSFTGLTGEVDGEGHFRLYAISGYAAGNSVVTLTDTAAFDAAPVSSGPATVSTAPAGNAYRGLAFAPTPEAALPTISLSAQYLAGTNGDPANPTVQVTVGQTGVPAADLTVAATGSGNAAVATAAGVTVEGSGATRTVSVSPAGGVGYANLTLTVTGAEGKSASVTLHYAASAASSTPATTRYHTGAADGSTAIDAGGGYMIVGDDENNTLRLYRDSVSGPPVKEWNFNSQMGNPEEIDIEASARVGDTIYWTGSMGNSKKGKLKPYRSTLFTTHISDEGAATELTFGGYYKGLRADLIKWDEEHGNRFRFAAGAAAGMVPKRIDGFNVEGMEFAAGSSETAYIGFRAPLTPAVAGGDALLVPVTNLAALATSGLNTSLHATFGEPILMDLEGLSIRDMRRNADGEYLILAGSWAPAGQQALYAWDGVPTDPPVKALDLPEAAGGGEESGAWEGIGSLPDPLLAGAEVTLVMDDGAADLYGDGQEAKDLTPEFQKSPSNTFTLTGPAAESAPAMSAPPTLGGSAHVGGALTCSPGEWTGTPEPTFAYEWQRDGDRIDGAEGAAYTASGTDAGHQLRCVVTATNSVGSAAATSTAATVLAVTCAGGPIVGAGSSLQAAAQRQLWAPAYNSVCGAGAAVTYEPSSSGAGLVAWGFGGGAFDGSKAFVASDEGPNPSQLAAAKAGSGSDVLTIPVAQTAVAIVVNPPAGCAVSELVNKQLEGIMQGRIKVWSKIATATGAGCVDAPIVRVVRQEGSGTTYQVKNYLLRINEGALPCTVGGGTWRSLEDIGTGTDEAPNTVWPENSAATGCLGQVGPLVRAEGGAGLVRKVNVTEGSIGYAALPDVEANKNGDDNPAGDTDWVKLQNNGLSTKLSIAKFASPVAAANSANCLDARYPVPTPAQVGKKDPANADWSRIFGANPNAAAASPNAYPLCALTYVEALTSYSNAGLTQPTEQTVKDYLTNHVLADPGQESLETGANFYAPLPTSSSPVYDILGAARSAAAHIAY